MMPPPVTTAYSIYAVETAAIDNRRIEPDGGSRPMIFAAELYI
jgi:hypothetical protein